MIKIISAVFIAICFAGCASMKPESDVAIRGLLSNYYWFNTTNNCRVADDYQMSDATYEWSGSCTNGYVSGCGMLKMVDGGNNKKWVNGCFVEGKRNGNFSISQSLLPGYISKESYNMGMLLDYQANMPITQAVELANKKNEVAAENMRISNEIVNKSIAAIGACRAEFNNYLNIYINHCRTFGDIKSKIACEENAPKNVQATYENSMRSSKGSPPSTLLFNIKSYEQQIYQYETQSIRTTESANRMEAAGLKARICVYRSNM